MKPTVKMTKCFIKSFDDQKIKATVGPLQIVEICRLKQDHISVKLNVRHFALDFGRLSK